MATVVESFGLSNSLSGNDMAPTSVSPTGNEDAQTSGIAMHSSSSGSSSTSSGSSGASGSSSSSVSDRFSPYLGSSAGNEISELEQILVNSLQLDSTSPTLSRKNSDSSNYGVRTIYEELPYCDAHHLVKNFFCHTCVWDVCSDCVQREHTQHYFYPALSYKDLMDESEKLRAMIKDNVAMIDRQLGNTQYKKITATNAIQQCFQRFHDALVTRERQMISSVNYVADCRTRALSQMMKEHQTVLSDSAQICDNMLESIRTGNSDNLLQYSRFAKKHLDLLRRTQKSYQYRDDDIAFLPPDETLIRSFTSMGSVVSPDLNAGPPPPLTINLRSANGQYFDGLLSPANILSPNNAMLSPNMQQFSPASMMPQYNLNGNAQMFFPARNDFNNAQQQQQQQVDIYGQNGSFPVSFHTNRTYGRIKKPVTIFGSEGSNPGELCRPWGVCCDRNGHIIVADRSNDRIQIFRQDGSFVRAFGSHGSEEGELNRPAGVAVDYYGRIVVTDKDNHRVQIFSMDGTFVFSFGERGQANGKFHYPWDVDVSSDGLLVISDTRNHRIQIFTGNGIFLKKFGYETIANMWKFFDSPRGVAWTSHNTVMVTDFNNHRIYEIDVDKSPKQVNCDAFKKCDLFRPQGLCLDPDGNILVADCRNNRIQVLDKFGQPIGQFGVPGKEPGQFDRPSGIACTTDGKIVVVDFGNHRVQVF